ncbi:MAG: hypothetical protein GKS00_06530 [Alphaproteobacteria bacterium]|nr:hypothetical protein [Alphaproteobacteria bacterium]
MWKVSKKCYVATAALSLLLAGCDNFAFKREGVRVWGPDPLIDRAKFEKINLAKEILAATSSEYSAGIDIDDAMRLFYGSAPSAELKLGRDRVQERILGASKQRCGEYRNFLKEFDAESNFFLGSLTTTLAGAGAIFTGTDVVRALSGSASIISGIRSELNEDFFHTLTIQVITEGFGAHREALYREIGKKQKQSIADYTLEAAIKDSVEFHENCSLLAGLEHAAKAIERAKDPGLTALADAADKIRVMRIKLRDAIDDDRIKVKPIEATDNTGDAAGSGVEKEGESTPLKAAKTPGDALVASIQASKTLELLNAEPPKYKGKTIPIPKVAPYTLLALVVREEKFECPQLPKKLAPDATATEADIRASETLLAQQCERIAKDWKQANDALAVSDGKARIVAKIEALVADGRGLLTDDAKAELAKLEADRLPLLAKAKTAEKGTGLVSAKAELALHEAKINSKLEIIKGAHTKNAAKLEESTQVLTILDNLKQRIENYDKAVAKLEERAGKKSAAKSGENSVDTGASSAPVTAVETKQLKLNEAARWTTVKKSPPFLWALSSRSGGEGLLCGRCFQPLTLPHYCPRL